MNFKVSIIIPVYNLEKYIGKTIESCLNQSYHDIEVIIVNDGSIDQSEPVIQGYINDKRIVYRKQTNMGVSEARNIGIHLATGDYITFLDGDDLLQADTVERNVEVILTQNVLPDWVAFPIIRINEEGEKISMRNTSLLDNFRYAKTEMKSSQEIFKMIEQNAFPTTVWAMFFRKSFFDCCFIDGRFEDSYMVMVLLQKLPHVLLSPYGAYLYRDRSDSFINSSWTASKWTDYTRMRIQTLRTAVFLFPSSRNFYTHRYIRMYYNLKYLRFKNRLDSSYARPLQLLLETAPEEKKIRFRLWLIYVIKCCLVFILRRKR